MNGMMFFICLSFVSWKYSCIWTDVRELQTVVGYFRWLVAQKEWWFAIAEWYRNWTARGPSSGDGNEVFQTACSLGNADSNGAIRQSWRSRRVPWNSPVDCVLSSHARCQSCVASCFLNAAGEIGHLEDVECRNNATCSGLFFPTNACSAKKKRHSLLGRRGPVLKPLIDFTMLENQGWNT